MISTKTIRYENENGELDHAIEIESPTGKNLTVLTPILQRRIPHHGWLELSVRAKATESDEFGLVLSYVVAGKRIELGESHPGGGEWKDLRFIVPVPRNATPASIQFNLVRRALSPDPAWADNASFTHYQHHPDSQGQPGPRDEELVFNGGFEHFTFFGFPGPWKTTRSGGAKAQPKRVPAAGEAQGQYAMSLPKPEEGGIGIEQRIYGVGQGDKGATLVARALGLATGDQSLVLRIRCLKNGKPMENLMISSAHPGDGKWHEWTTQCTLPTENFPDAVMIDVFRHNASDAPVMVDEISMKSIKTRLELP